jgi:hypothetical protein
MTGQHGPTPVSVANLTVAEQFVLWALRTRLEGAARRAHLERASASQATRPRAPLRSRRSSRGSRYSPGTAGAISISIVRPVHA